MKVKKSKYIERVRPMLQKLLDRLLLDYRYVSILAADCRSKRYRVNRSGGFASEDDLFFQRGFVLRVMDEIGFAEYSFNVITEEKIPEICAAVKEELLPLTDCLPEMISFMEREVPADEELTFEGATEYQIHPEEMGEKEILNRLAEIRELGLKKDERILDVAAGIGWQETHKLFLSAGRTMEQDVLWTDGHIVAMAKRDQEIKSEYIPFSNLGGVEIMDEMRTKVLIPVDVVLELLDSKPLTPGTYECICTPDVTGMIVHEAFGHGVEMDMFVKDRALASKCIGDYVASPLVTMHDGAAEARETGSYFFDDEGTEAHDTVIIDKGVLVTGISDYLSAKALGTAPTGNGRRESFERKTYTRMTNTWFEGGRDSVEDMIASVKDGLLLESPSSGMEDPKNWGIQCMVNFAREIRDGKLTGTIYSPIVLSGYVPDLLKSITMMSPAPHLSGSGMCGKGYKEWVKVSCGGPYIKAKIRLG